MSGQQLETRPFGLWESPFSPGLLADSRRLDRVRFDSDGRTLVWLEGRSDRGLLVAQTGLDAPRDLTVEQRVRAEVGYGGGDFTCQGGCAYFVERGTGRLWRQPIAQGPAQRVTPPVGQAASPVVSPDGRWLVYVHHDDQGVDRLAIVDSEGRRWPQILASGHDFYMQPRFSPDGRHLAWVAWDHPNMPWDGTLLQLAELTGGDDEETLPRLGQPRVVAGGEETSVFQPEFSRDGRQLLYVSDESGWGRIMVADIASGDRHALTPDGVELATPAWLQDMRTYALLADGRQLVAAVNRQGFQSVELIDLASGESAVVEPLAEYTEVSDIVAAGSGQRIAIIGSGPAVPPRLVECDLASGEARVVARATGETVSPQELARCDAVSWRSGGETVHGLFYPPVEGRFRGTGQPPLIVVVHGGPTSQVRAGWRPDAQYYATRGWAVLYVNYRGSTGYGRPYMLELRGQWGEHDVADSVSGAKYLADAKRVDPQRMVIMGGSAGGFTVLEALSWHPEVFAAGISLYGVADQFHLAAETHKFERHYLDSLLGPLPESAEVYRQRSPVLHADRIGRPLAVFQGATDRVVPKEQSDRIVDVLRRRNVPHVYHVYEGEGHGWRKRETIEHYYGAVEQFLREYVLFT